MKKHIVLLFYTLLLAVLLLPLCFFLHTPFIGSIGDLFYFRVKPLPLLTLLLAFGLVFIYDIFWFADEEQFFQNYIVIKRMLGDSRRKLRVFLISFLSGVTEELLFRGYFLFFLIRVVHLFPVLAVVIVSLLFGVFHINQGKATFILSSIISAALCYFVLATGSIVIPALFHMVFNFCQLFFVIPYQKDKFSGISK